MRNVAAVLLASVALAVALTAATWVAPVVRLDWWDIAIGAWVLGAVSAAAFVHGAWKAGD